jgi:biopolymer transport protein ExbD
MSIRLSHSDDGLAETHEINVTPFIDVMLVLMIIFMVTAPLTTVDIPVQLPAAKTEAKPARPDPVFLTLQRDMTLSLGNNHVPRAGLGAALEAATRHSQETPIFLRADKSVSYGQLMELLNLVRSSGYLNVALVGLEEASSSSGEQRDGGK